MNYTWNLKKKKKATSELTYKTKTDSQTQKTHLQLPKRKGGGINQKFGIKINTLLYLKQLANKDLVYSNRKLYSRSYSNLQWKSI